MNKHWKQYIEKINQQVKKLSKEEKEKYNQLMQQRLIALPLEETIMRMWVEAKAYELTPMDYHTIALYIAREKILSFF